MLLLMLLGPVAAEETKTVTYRGITVSTDTEYVDLEKRGVTDWDGFYAFLKQLPNLKKVDMYNTVINLKVYKKLNELFPDVEFGAQFRYGRHRVRTDDTAFSTLYSGGDRQHSYEEIEMLTWCKNLYALDIGHHPVKKLDFLYEMPELRVLIVALCDLTDITPIASLKHLEYLEIFHNRITDVSCLTGLDHLMDLDLVQNYVEDLSPLAEIKSLKRLWIYRNIKDDLESPDEATVKMLQAVPFPIHAASVEADEAMSAMPRSAMDSRRSCSCIAAFSGIMREPAWQQSRIRIRFRIGVFCRNSDRLFRQREPSVKQSELLLPCPEK